MSKSWLIRGGGTIRWKNERRDSGRKKGAHELGQLPTSLAAFMDQFREGKAYLYLKFNLAKSYKQELPLTRHTALWKSRRRTYSAALTVPLQPSAAAPVAADIKK